MRRHFGQTLPSFAEARRLADSITQVIELGPANATGSLHVNLGNLGRVKGEYSFHALALNDAPDCEHGPQSFSALGNHHAAENLNAFLLPFQNALVHFD